MWVGREDLGLLRSELATIRKLVFFIIKQEHTALTDLTTMQADVAAQTAETAIVVKSLDDLKAAAAALQAKLDAALAADDPAAVAALAAQIEKNTADLTAAVAAVTPAPPAA